MAKWQATIPQPSKRCERKRCYYYISSDLISGYVWLTDSEVTRYTLEDYRFEEVHERDLLNRLEKYKNRSFTEGAVPLGFLLNDRRK